jgi:putative PEP-CTERM system TPR-repeat lipoprotein
MSKSAPRLARARSVAAIACLLAGVAIAPAHAAPATSRADGFYQQAQQLYGKGDLRAAEIQLKNALQRDPKHLAARKLLGEVYLKLGNGPSAEKELTAARRGGATDPDITALIARSLLLQGRLDDVLKEVSGEPSDPSLRAEFLLLRGQALVGLKQFAEAQVALAEADRLRPDDLRAKVASANILVGQGKLDEAEQEVDNALARRPDAADAQVLKGELRRYRRDSEGAVGHFTKALEIDPENVGARIARGAALIEVNRDDEADQDIQSVLRRFPKHPLATHFAAVLLFKKKDFAAAQELLVPVAPQLQDHMPSVLLLGNLAYALKQMEQAIVHLERFVGVVPGNTRARKLLGAALIRQREPLKAIALLEPMLQRMPNDPQLLSDLGSAYLLLGKVNEATEYYRRAADAAPDEALIRTRLAFSQIAGGETDEAIGTLERTLEHEPDAQQAAILLALVKLRKGEYDGALQAAQRLQKQAPNNPIATNLIGAAHLGKGDTATARQNFEKALEMKPDFHPARMNLAQIELHEGRVSGARQQYETILAADAKNSGAMLAMAQLAERENRPDDVVAWLQRAAEADPKSSAPRLRLIAHYSRLREFDKALSVARELAQSDPSNPNVLEALGRTELAAGEAASAVHTFRRLSAAAGNPPAALGLIASAQIAARDVAGAKATLNEALEKDPSNVQVKIILIEIETREGDAAAALSMATELRNSHPELAAADMLVGDIRMREKRYDDAIAAYEAGLSKSETAVLALRRFTAQRQAGRLDEALSVLQAWVDRTGDRAARQILANTYISLARVDEALREAEKLSDADKNNPVMLNNLAWLYQQKGDKRAKQYAEQAYKMSPKSPEIMDTLGWIYVESGDAQRGLDLLRKANELAPTQGVIHYHYAVALHQTGRSQQAKRELEKLLRSDHRSGIEKEARELLRSLPGG